MLWLRFGVIVSRLSDQIILEPGISLLQKMVSPGLIMLVWPGIDPVRVILHRQPGDASCSGFTGWPGGNGKSGQICQALTYVLIVRQSSADLDLIDALFDLQHGLNIHRQQKYNLLIVNIKAMRIVNPITNEVLHNF